MLCMSAAYVDARCPPVRLSVCPSVTFVYSIETNKHTFKFFSPSDSRTILVFPHQTLWQNGGQMQVKEAKIAIFYQYLAFRFIAGET